MKNILIIVDKGDVWEITGAMVQTDEYEVDPEMVHEIKSRELFNYIKNTLKTSSIQFSKDTEGELIEEDLEIYEYDELLLKKENTLNKARIYISTRLNAISLFELYEFTLCNNILVEAGFTITDANRKEKYLEIIDKGDINLIDALERFLKSKDRLEIVNSWYKQYREFELDIYNCHGIYEVNDRYKTFVQIFE